MRLFTSLMLAVLVLPLAAGCGSSNKPKLDGTKWSAASTTLDGKAQDAGFLELEFDNDGSFVFRQLEEFQPGQKTRSWSEYRGSYTSSGDKVKLEFSNPWREKQDYEYNFVIDAKDKLTLTDTDNKPLTFYRQKEKAPEPPPPEIPKPVTKGTDRGPKK